jgi:hypothetical protein
LTLKKLEEDLNYLANKVLELQKAKEIIGEVCVLIKKGYSYPPEYTARWIKFTKKDIIDNIDGYTKIRYSYYKDEFDRIYKSNKIEITDWFDNRDILYYRDWYVKERKYIEENAKRRKK